MYNANNQMSKDVAARLSNAIRHNDQVPMRANRENTGYIGEMNVINSSTVPVLLELGFFSNVSELETICSDSYVQYVSTQLANEITSIIKNK
jgi:N-acetylmuramoyl-L-alanine amidase